MKNKSVLLFSKCCSVLFLVFLYGCVPQINLEEHRNKWIARPLSELKQAMNKPDSYAKKVQWEETTYPLANGDFVFVEPISNDCSVHWEVHPEGIIIGFRTKGNGCEQGQKYDFIKELTAPSTK